MQVDILVWTKMERRNFIIDQTFFCFQASSLSLWRTWVSDDGRFFKKIPLANWKLGFVWMLCTYCPQLQPCNCDVRTIDCRVHMGKTFLPLDLSQQSPWKLLPSWLHVWGLVRTAASISCTSGKLDPALKHCLKVLTGYRNEYRDKNQIVVNMLRNITAINTGMGNSDKAADIDKYVNLHSSVHYQRYFAYFYTYQMHFQYFGKIKHYNAAIQY